MTFKLIISLFFVFSCSFLPQSQENTSTLESGPRQDFPRGELYLVTEILAKIYDREMTPLVCIPDRGEAELFLRTIRPRMEQVYDDTEAKLDLPEEVENLISTCDQDCTCGLVDDLIREHQVKLSKAQQKTLNHKVSEKEINRCLGFTQSTFCQSELYQILNKEKVDFSFESDL